MRSELPVWPAAAQCTGNGAVARWDDGWMMVDGRERRAGPIEAPTGISFRSPALPTLDAARRPLSAALTSMTVTSLTGAF